MDDDDLRIPPSAAQRGLTRGPEICRMLGMTFHHARNAGEEHCTLITLEESAGERAKETFANLIFYGSRGILELKRPDVKTAILKTALSGTLSHLSSLNWKLTRKIKAFVELAKIVEEFHQKNTHLGPLSPETILLDDRLAPILIGTMDIENASPYRAPELSTGIEANIASDIYGLGQLLRFVLDQKEPPPETSELPRLDELMGYPAGLSRIARKAILSNPAKRYPNVSAMISDLEMYGRYQDVGVAHPDVEEENLGGISLRPILKKRPKAAKKKQDTGPRISLAAKADETFRLQPRIRLAMLFIGILAIFGTLVFTWVAGASILIRVLLALSTGVIGYAVFNTEMEKEGQLRLIFGTFGFLLLFVLNPAPMLAKYKQRAALKSADPQTQLEAFKSLVDKGSTVFENLDLKGADLQGQSFPFSRLINVSFEGANLKGSNFFQANLLDVRFGEADLSAAKFSRTSVEDTIDFELAICDEESILPAGWQCIDEHPAKTNALDSKE